MQIPSDIVMWRAHVRTPHPNPQATLGTQEGLDQKDFLFKQQPQKGDQDFYHSFKITLEGTCYFSMLDLFCLLWSSGSQHGLFSDYSSLHRSFRRTDQEKTNKLRTSQMYFFVPTSVYVKKYKSQTMLTSSMKAWSMRHPWEQPLISIIFMRLHCNVIIIKKAGIDSVLFTSVTSASSRVPDTQKLAE